MNDGNLIKLINSLSKAEKTYFKKYALLHTIGKKNNYLKLFDILEKYLKKKDIKSDDFNKLLEKEKLSSQYISTKAYLFKMILKSLRSFHGKNSFQLYSFQKIEDIENLVTKGLFNAGYKILKKLKKTLIEAEDYKTILILINFEKELCRKLYGLNELGFSKNKEIEAEEMEFLNKIKNAFEFTCLLNNLFELAFGDKKNGMINFEKAKMLMESKLLSNISHAYSLDAKITYHRINAIYYLKFCDNKEKSYEHYIQIVTLIESKLNCKLNDKIYIYYIYIIQCLIGTSLLLGKISNAEIHMQKLHSVISLYSSKISLKEKYTIELGIYVEELCLNLTKVDYNLVKESLDNLRLFIKRKNNYLDKFRVHSIEGIAAVASFIIGRYDDTLLWINQIFKLSEYDYTGKIYDYIKILNLILQYELKNPNLDSIIKSTYMFCTKRHELKKFTITIINFFKQLNKKNNKQDIHYLFHQLKLKLQCLNKDNVIVQDACSTLKLELWVESKLQEKSMLELLRQENINVSKEKV